MAWYCRTYSSRPKRKRRRKVLSSSLLAQWLIATFGKYKLIILETHLVQIIINIIVNHLFPPEIACVPYQRLTPPYLVVIALTGFVSIYLRDTSQYWMIEHNDINCPKYWWRNLFYIQNMYPLDDMCMTWSWFLAADFQCFCLTSLLLVIYTKWVHRTKRKEKKKKINQRNIWWFSFISFLLRFCTS